MQYDRSRNARVYLTLAFRAQFTARHRHGNFGIGARFSAAPRDPHGLVYMSWKRGVGHMVHLWFDPHREGLWFEAVASG